MKIKATSFLLLGLAATVSVLLGCGAAPASQAPEDVEVREGQRVVQPTTVPAQTEPVEVESEPQAVEIGYKVGMQAPEFGMSLLDGSRVTTASIVDEGKPVLLYFHATY